MTMRRREFIVGAAATWSLAAQGQTPSAPPRRIGAVMGVQADNPLAPPRIGAFAQGLQELGWTIGANVRIEYRWGTGGADFFRRLAGELLTVKPDVILATGSGAVVALQQATRTVPVVFVNVVDPVGAGFVESLARPGGNLTGFTPYEYGIGGKWLELLKEIAPRVKRVAVLRDADLTVGIGVLGAIQSVAPSLGIELRPIVWRDAGEIERGIAAFAGTSNGGMVVTGGGLSIANRELIVKLAGSYKLPTVYHQRIYVAGGGLISYGQEEIDPYRRAAEYIGRILNGEKPADLPVQAPVKFETVINLKTAKALGLTIPEALLATADEVIQ
jgi:putative ABC transport system substrate-binding protein